MVLNLKNAATVKKQSKLHKADHHSRFLKEHLKTTAENFVGVA